MSYRKYLVKMKKNDFHQLKSCEKELIKEYIHDEDWCIRSLCYGPKAHIILEVEAFELDLNNKIPNVFPFSDFNINSFQIINKNEFKTMINTYKERYRCQIEDSIVATKEEYQAIINDESIDSQQKLQWLWHMYKKEMQKNTLVSDNLDYIFNFKSQSGSNEDVDCLLDSYFMYDNLINLFYIYRHFDWQTDYLIYAAW